MVQHTHQAAVPRACKKLFQSQTDEFIKTTFVSITRLFRIANKPQHYPKQKINPVLIVLNYNTVICTKYNINHNVNHHIE